MKFKKLLLASAMATGILQTAGAVDILVESFETDGSTLTGDGRYENTSEFNDGSSDHWGRTDDIITPVGNVSGDYTGMDGTFFWAAEDVNDNGGNGLNPQTIQFNNINISGFDNLVISGLFGAGNEGGLGANNYDETDYITVQYEIDGGGFMDGLCFNYEPGSVDSNPVSNEPIGFDVDCNGQSEGPLFRLGTALQEFTFNISETGNTMNLLISVAMDSGSEEVAFDNIKLTGDMTGVDSPPAVTSTAPADDAIDVAIDSDVSINFSEAVNILVNAVEINCVNSGLQTFPSVAELNVTSLTIDATDFDNSEVCTVTIDSASVSDLDGTPDNLIEDFVFDFTTIADLAPEVTTTDPVDGSVGFSNMGNISIDFSEAINATNNAVTMNCSTTGNVSFSGLPVNGGQSITLDPTVDLVDSETCNLTVVAAEVADIDGNPDNMVTDFMLSFTVGFPVVEIFEIQGAGTASPFDGVIVSTNDNIVTALDTNGFYMQTPDDRDDADPLTSNGIFVFTGSPVPVNVGDQIDLQGEIVEFFDLTEFTNPNGYVLNIDSSDNPLPTAVLLDDNFPPTDPTVFPCGDESLVYECFEGMLFDMPQGFISAASVSFFGANRDDQMVKAGSSRAFREPGIEYPGLMGLPVFDGNPELLEMDVDALGLDLAANSYAAGSEVAIKGVFGFDFGEYEIWPSEITVINENVIPAAVRDVQGDEITVASANIRRFFNDVNDPGDEDDDQIEDSQVYADRLDKISEYVVADLKSPVIIALQEIESRDVLLDLAVEIVNIGGPSYIPLLVEGNDQGGIDVAYMYQSGRLSNITLTQLGKDEVNPFDSSLLHDRPPLRLEADVLFDSGSISLNLLNVHMRSRGGIDDNVDGDRVRNKRLSQANSVASMAESILVEDPDKSLYVLGDFNAFQFTDGYVDVVGQITGEAVETDNLLWSEPVLIDTPLTQAVQSLASDQQYSFVFGGSAQILDNALTNDVGLMNLVDIQFVRGQSDANINLEEDATTSARATDHDGFVLYISEDLDLIFKNGFE